ncbi:MAG: class D beta-lactamase [Desulfobacteraceae bacterium]|nr:class D beta-lactamase [Desulfobacteraceae bacterium]
MTQVTFKTILILSLISMTIGTANAEDSDLAALFSERNVKGTIIISSSDGKTEYLHNKARAEKRFLPASTFKIPNTLIALEEGAVPNEKEIIRWDGKDRGWPLWNKDQSLETAFPISCVWFYQELAKRVGNAKYLSHLDKLNYGNKMTGPEVTTFWLNGDLKISAIEQIEFLKRLYKDELPYKKNHVNLLKKVMIVEETPKYVIRAKTGWAMRINHQHGWYVGYAEANGQVWFFAVNIEIGKKSDAAYRKEITMKALKLKGII